MEVQLIFVPVYVKRKSEAATYLFGVTFSITASHQKLMITEDIHVILNVNQHHKKLGKAVLGYRIESIRMDK